MHGDDDEEGWHRGTGSGGGYTCPPRAPGAQPEEGGEGASSLGFRRQSSSEGGDGRGVMSKSVEVCQQAKNEHAKEILHFALVAILSLAWSEQYLMLKLFNRCNNFRAFRKNNSISSVLWKILLYLLSNLEQLLKSYHDPQQPNHRNENKHRICNCPEFQAALEIPSQSSNH